MRDAAYRILSIPLNLLWTNLQALNIFNVKDF